MLGFRSPSLFLGLLSLPLHGLNLGLNFGINFLGDLSTLLLLLRLLLLGRSSVQLGLELL